MKKFFTCAAIIFLLSAFYLPSYGQLNAEGLKVGLQFNGLLPFDDFYNYKGISDSYDFSYLGRGFFRFDIAKGIQGEVGGGYGRYQGKDIADEHPDIVAELRKEYEQWWSSVSEQFDDYCEIILGAAEENPTRLNCMDWHTDIEQIPWNQTHILKGLEGNGFWATLVSESGNYRFELRRWPEEADTPISGAVEGGKAIPITEARLKIGDVELTKAVVPEDHAATFEVNLKAGSTRLQTWFTDKDGGSRGAYYVYVTRQ